MVRNLMMDLLDLGQMEHNTFKINEKEFNFIELIKNTFLVVGHCASIKKINLNFAVVNPSHRPIFEHIISDPDRLSQVLINLLSNSLKFSQERSKIDVSLRIRNIAAEKVTFELCIEDYGLGIPEDKIDSLFIDFNSLDEHKKVNASGRGLGLSICRMIIDKMGGNVNVKSKVGVGSTFIITMDVLYYPPSQPLIAEPNKEIAASYNSRQQVDSGSISPVISSFSYPIHHNVIQEDDGLGQRKMRMLFVNDDEFLSLGYKDQLSPFFTMYFATNGQQAIEKVAQNANDFFDIILMDINMPVMDGFQAMKVI